MSDSNGVTAQDRTIWALQTLLHDSSAQWRSRELWKMTAEQTERRYQAALTLLDTLQIIPGVTEQLQEQRHTLLSLAKLTPTQQEAYQVLTEVLGPRFHDPFSD